MLKKLLDKCLKRHISQSNKKEISFLGRPLAIYESIDTIPKAIGLGSRTVKTYNAYFLSGQSSCQSNKDNTDLIANDPFFSQIERTINNIGLKQAILIYGSGPISAYINLLKNRLDKQYNN